MAASARPASSLVSLVSESQTYLWTDSLLSCTSFRNALGPAIYHRGFWAATENGHVSVETTRQLQHLLISLPLLPLAASRKAKIQELCVL